MKGQRSAKLAGRQKGQEMEKKLIAENSALSQRNEGI